MSSATESINVSPKKKTKPKTTAASKKEEPKKINTKDMIHQALGDLRSRKGTSLQSIKKYIQEKYDIDTEKNNSLINKTIKASVKLGTIVQTKGVGATGSFKLAVVKEKEKIEKKEKSKEVKKIKEPIKKGKETKKVVKEKGVTVVSENESENETKKKKNKIKVIKSKTEEKKVVKIRKPKESKPGDGMKTDKKTMKTDKKTMKTVRTPAKKNITKRKSIGSIIKKPIMKPKAM